MRYMDLEERRGDGRRRQNSEDNKTKEEERSSGSDSLRSDQRKAF
jgi:hypothetical protein